MSLATLGTMSTWDPAQYLRYDDERTRPFLDLIGQVRSEPDQISTVVDVGCGPGHLTAFLCERWPDAAIVGVDSSAEMIARATSSSPSDHVSYVVADASRWLPDFSIDLLVSNATLQWLPDQFATLDRLLTRLAQHGVVAIAVPDNADRPTHRLLDDFAGDQRFAEAFGGIRAFPPIGPRDYVDFFASRGFSVNAWSTTYTHILRGDDPVFEWVAGTRLRPYLAALDETPALRTEFVAEYQAQLRSAFPSRPWGTPFEFRRTFAVATREN